MTLNMAKHDFILWQYRIECIRLRFVLMHLKYLMGQVSGPNWLPVRMPMLHMCLFGFSVWLHSQCSDVLPWAAVGITQLFGLLPGLFSVCDSVSLMLT